MVIFLVGFISFEHMIGYGEQTPGNGNLGALLATSFDQALMHQIPALASSAGHSGGTGHGSS